MTTLGHERATSVLNYQFSFVREMRQLTALARERNALADPGLRSRIVDSYMGLQIMEYNNLRTLQTALKEGQFGPEASIGKYYWSKWHQNFTEVAMDVLGPAALLGTDWTTTDSAEGAEVTTDDATALRRAFVRARAETIYAGASEIQKNIISERVLKLPKEPRP